MYNVYIINNTGVAVKVFKYRLLDQPEVYHVMAADTMDAILDICETWTCTEADITNFEPVEPLSARRPR